MRHRKFTNGILPAFRPETSQPARASDIGLRVSFVKSVPDGRNEGRVGGGKGSSVAARGEGAAIALAMLAHIFDQL
jgi:hypothetical protein